MQELQNYAPQEQQTAISLIMSIDPQRMAGELSSIANFQKLVNSNLTEGHDYGVIPGTGNKPTLLKPGAEKILMLMGLQSQYEVVDKVENWDGGFFAYTVRATLVHDGQVITQGMGAANTKENRYQLKEWSDSEKKKVWDGTTYQDPYTLQNTVLKMAKKRAQVDATLTVASLSDVFTQDTEDMKDFLQSEQQHTAATGDVSDIKITFGKHKGETIGQIGSTKDGHEYLEWLSKNARQADMKAAVTNYLSKSTNGQQTASQTQQGQQQAPTGQQQAPQPRYPQPPVDDAPGVQQGGAPWPTDNDAPDLPFS
jgi:hypothetical protein